MRRTVFRIVLIAGVLVYLATVSIDFAGAWLLSLPLAENLDRAARLQPGNPKLWQDYGKAALYAQSGKPGQGIEFFRRAAALNPLDPDNWEGLASSYMAAGEMREAEAALREWLAATPHAPDTNWRMGNFLIQQDRVREAFPYLKTAASGDPSLCAPLFDLAWKVLPDEKTILRELVPTDSNSRVSYLRYLVVTERLPQAYSTWKEVRADRTNEELMVGYQYVEALAAAQMGEAAAQVWGELLADTGRSSAKPPGELLTNGDFEAGLPNRGLDWRLAPGPGYQIELDETTAQSGSHSLRVEFDGTQNQRFVAIVQTVPVEPDRDYRLQGYLKAENLSTDNGVRFVVRDADANHASGSWQEAASNVGTIPWKLEQLDFHTGPATRLVNVYLYRPGSTKFDDLIRGTVWIDAFSLRLRP